MIQRVKRNGQVTIPIKVRKLLGIEDGDYLTCAREAAKIVFEKVEVSLSPEFYPADRILGFAIAAYLSQKGGTECERLE